MTYFIPMRHKEAMDILAKVYQQAMQEADVIGKRQKLTMRVEPLRPVHLNLAETTFKLEYNSGNEKAYTLQQNCAIFLAGIEQYESGLTHVKLRNGKKYLGDWVTRPVYKYQEQMGEKSHKQRLSKHTVQIAVSAAVCQQDRALLGALYNFPFKSKR